MIPYSNFTFFFIAGILLLPVIIMGCFGKRSKLYNGIITVILLVLIFASDEFNLWGNRYVSYQLLNFIIYTIWQLAIIMYYWKSRQRSNTFGKFFMVIFLSILPLIIVKVWQSSWLGEYRVQFHEIKLIQAIGFLGISYITFKSVQLLMEIRDGSIKEVKAGKVLQFITFSQPFQQGRLIVINVS